MLNPGLMCRVKHRDCARIDLDQNGLASSAKNRAEVDSLLAKYLFVAMLVSFPLHFAWEWSQCQPYFIHGATSPSVSSMLMATGGDLVLTALAYALVAIVHGPRWGLGRWRLARLLTLLVVALALASGVELYALAAGRWIYTDIAPLVPGTKISVLPVMQLLVLLPLSLFLARFITLKA